MKQRKILITGGAGYIGATLVSTLLNAGHEITVVDNLSTGNFKFLHHNYRFIKASLNNFLELQKVFICKNQPVKYDVVFHLAAKLAVKESVFYPLSYFYVNVTGTLNLLRLMQHYHIYKMVFSSTAAIYASLEDQKAIEEDCLIAPLNAYGESKYMCERLLYHASRALDFQAFQAVCLRYFNVAGINTSTLNQPNFPIVKSQPFGHLIPVIIKALKTNKEFYVFGNDYNTIDGTCIRDYIHVSDLVNAHFLSYQYLVKNPDVSFATFNLGTGKGHSINEIISKISKIFHQKLKVIYSPKRPGDGAALVANSNKVQKKLNWACQFALEDILKSEYEHQ